MIAIKIDFHCKVCDNNDKFYIMPLDKKVHEHDVTASKTDFLLRCTKCNQKYLLNYNYTIKII